MAQSKESARAPRRRLGLVALVEQQIRAKKKADEEAVRVERRKRRRQLDRNRRRREAAAAIRKAKLDKKNEGKVSSEWHGADATNTSADLRRPRIRPEAVERASKSPNNQHITPAGDVKPGLNAEEAPPSADKDLDAAIKQAIREGRSIDVLNLIEARHRLVQLRRAAILEEDLRHELKARSADQAGVGELKFPPQAIKREAVGKVPSTTDEAESVIDSAARRLAVVLGSINTTRGTVLRASSRIYGSPPPSAAGNPADKTSPAGQLERLFEVIGLLESEVDTLSSDVGHLTKGF